MSVWPVGITKIELDDGHPYFYGAFTAADVARARRAFSGRPVTLDPQADGYGNLVVHMAGCGEGSCPLWPQG